MTKTDQKKLIGAIISVLVLLLGAWQLSLNPTAVSSARDSEQEEYFANTPEGYAPLSRVVDGDTIEVAFSQTDKYTVRFIGIDTPESVDPRKPVECFGKEATEHLKELLTGPYVRLETDTTQLGEDKYGRWLRVVYREDGMDVGLQMIKDGYAHEYTYDTPYIKQAEYKAAEAEAKAEKIGLWSPDTCNGNR